MEKIIENFVEITIRKRKGTDIRESLHKAQFLSLALPENKMLTNSKDHKTYFTYSWIIWIVCQIIFLSISVDAQWAAESEVAEFTFLSTANGSNLHQSEYHVISVSIPSKQDSYTMHLAKPNNLFTPSHLGIRDTEATDYQCLYTGTLSSSRGERAGIASLSSCFHETGFEGLLFLENEQYYITPDHTALSHRSKRSSNKFSKTGSKSKVTAKHKIAKPRAGSSTPKRRIDSKRVPEEELKKAREQMIKDQESLDDEDDEDDDADNSNHNIDSSSNRISSTLSIAGTEFDEENPSGSMVEMETFGTRFQTKTTGQRRPKKRPAQRLAKVIELAIFTDEAFYRKWNERFPEDTTKKINQYVLALVNNMNLLYQQPSMGPKITFRLVNVGVQKTIPSGLQPSKIAENYLDSFCVFAGKKDTRGAIWDHAMMITGLELEDQTGNDNLGIAFTSTMCLRYWSCSVLEYNKGFETAFTAAHELGHSLGMEHDGEAMNKKCDPSKFIMAAIAGSGQINWSPCSSENAQNFLASGDPRARVKDPSSVPRCLRKRGSRKRGIKYRTGKFPGKIFGTKRQCNQVCDQCVPYIMNQAPYNNICKELHCQKPNQEIVSAHPALEGTACGPGGKKMCRNGLCQ